MEKDYFRYYKPKVLLVTIIILSIVYSTILHFVANCINSFLTEPYVFFPTRYEGNITYKHFETDIEEKKPCFLEIEQSLPKILIQT
jgi:hypothetical protein